MRNLKRALSLALASIMVLGMMVVGAGAVNLDDFSDKDKIVNTEAVTVLTTLNVINGKDDGTYDPEGIVTRAEMAKMICVILNGGKDPQLGQTLQNSYTDTVGHWAAPYIEYCTTLGIVSGRGNGTFDPNGTVTVAEAGKMVLVALGYNAGVEGYTGANWQINTDVRANELDIYDGLGTLNTNIDLTRDNAAQMLYNALDVHMVIYDYIITGTAENAISTKPQLNDTDKGTLLWEKFGAVKVVGVVEANEFANLSSTKTDTDKAPSGTVIGASLDEGKTQVRVTNSGDDQGVYANRDYTFSVSTGEEELGKAVYMYIKPANNSSNSLKATVLGSAIISDENVIVADASGDSAADVADDNNLDLTADTKYVYNYASMGSKAPAGKDGMTGIQKTLVDVDADGDVDYVLYKEMGLGKVTLYTDAKDGQIVVNMSGTGTVSGNFVNKDKADIVGFEDVAKDDYVLSAYFGGKLYVQKAETVTGTIEAYKQTEIKNSSPKAYRNTGFTVDGTAYTVSRVGAYTGDLYAAVDQVDKTILSSDATFYMDLNGYVIAYGEVDESAYKYAYVWGAEAGTTISTDRVKVTLETGTTKTYDLSSNCDIDILDNASNLDYVSADKSYTIGEETIIGMVFSYTLTSDGEIKLYLPKNGAVKQDDPQFTNGLTAIKFADAAVSEDNLKPNALTKVDEGKVYYSNNATTFFYVTTKDGTSLPSKTNAVDKVSVYNGRNAAPTLDGKSGEALLALNNKGDVGSAVYTNVDVAESAGDHMFVYDANYVWEDYGYVDAYLNDTTDPLEDVKAALVENNEIVHNPEVADGIYLYKLTNKGYYEITDPAGKPYYFEGTVGRVNKAQNTFVITSDGTTSGSFVHEFQLTKDSIVVDYDSSHSSPVAYANGSVSVGDTVQIIVNNADDSEVLMAAIMDRVDATTGGGVVDDSKTSDFFDTASYNRANREIEFRYYKTPLTAAQMKTAASELLDVDVEKVNAATGYLTTVEGDAYAFTEIEMVRVRYNGKAVAYVDMDVADQTVAFTASAANVVIIDEDTADTAWATADGSKKVNVTVDLSADVDLTDAYAVNFDDTAITVKVKDTAIGDGDYVANGIKATITSSAAQVMVRDDSGKVTYVADGKTYTINGSDVTITEVAMTISGADDISTITGKDDVKANDTITGSGSELTEILGKNDIDALDNQQLVFGYEIPALTNSTLQLVIRDASGAVVYGEKYTSVTKDAGIYSFYIDITEGQWNSSNTNTSLQLGSPDTNTWTTGAMPTGSYTWTISDGSTATYGIGSFTVS